MTPDRFGHQTVSRGVAVDQGLRAHFQRVYNVMAGGLVLTGIVAWFTSQNPAMVSFLLGAQSSPLMGLLIAFSPMIILMMAFNPAMIRRMSATAMTLVFFAFSAYFGWLLSVIFLAYTAESIAKVFFVTAATFAAMSIWGYTTRRDLSTMSSFLMMGALGLLIAMVVNMFLASSMLSFVISGVGVLLYTLMVAFDTQNIKESYSESYGQEANAKMAVMGALSLYLNFIMLFQFLLQFMGNRN
jgi:FtsH-binding integral membrane protein